MIAHPTEKLTDCVAEVEAAVRDRDAARMTAAVPLVWQACQEASVAELDEALPRCVALLPRLGLGAGGQFSVLCGALVELGARPDPLIATVADGLAAALTEADRFRAGWRRVRGEAALPDAGEQSAMQDAAQAMIEAYRAEDSAFSAVQGWFSAGTWAMPAATLLQHSAAVREAFPYRDVLLSAAEKLHADRPDLDPLIGLLRD
jgi:hypothetical protein